MLFADKPRVEIDLTTEISKVQNLPFIPYQCCTGLYDAVYVGMEKIKQASYPKRALVVVTDAADNHRRFTSSNLRDFAREQNVQIFSIGARALSTMSSTLRAATHSTFWRVLSWVWLRLTRRSPSN